VNGPPDLFTIGYEASTLPAVLSALKSARVGLLIDVRAVAASRKPGFSKRLLAGSLDDAGIRYLHLQALGTPKPGRDAARAGRVAEMHRIFRAHMESDRAQAELTQARAAAGSDRACLLCFERDHHACHRALVAEMIQASSGQAVIHLTPKD
jgi:uncharacterized protein (DUF488 family)